MVSRPEGSVEPLGLILSEALMTTPYPVAFLSALLKPSSRPVLDIERYEEASSSARGQGWTAEIGRPLWTVSMDLFEHPVDVAREIDAKVRALGTNKPFLWVDPTYDLGGRVPGASVTVRAISPDRTQISLQGLPAGYPIKIGDRLSINHGGNWYFAEFATASTANASGQTGLMSVTPYPLLTLAAGASVELAAPILQVRVPQGAYRPFLHQRGNWSTGASISLLQKV